MEKNPLSISFLIVNFQSRVLLARSLASIQKLSPPPEEIIIVNNDPEALDSLGQFTVPIRVIQAHQNMGFGRAVNLGSRLARGDYLFLLNPDAEIATPSLLPALEEFEKNPRLSILGVKIVARDGKVQPWIAGEKITLAKLLLNNLGLNPQKMLSYNSKTKVDWVSGAGMMLKKDFFDRLGGFDENIFLYYEDTDLCLRAKNSGFDVLYFPQLVVQHLGGSSFKNRKEQKKYYYQSQQYYFQKHFGKLQALIIKLLRFIFG